MKKCIVAGVVDENGVDVCHYPECLVEETMAFAQPDLNNSPARFFVQYLEAIVGHNVLSDDQLQELLKLARSKGDCIFKPGDQVRLKSGGPIMTVSSVCVTTYDDSVAIYCGPYQPEDLEAAITERSLFHDKTRTSSVG